DEVYRLGADADATLDTAGEEAATAGGGAGGGAGLLGDGVAAAGGSDGEDEGESERSKRKFSHGSRLLFCVFGAPFIQLLQDWVHATRRVAHLVLGHVVVGLEFEALLVEKRGGFVVVHVLGRGLSLVWRLAKAFELALKPGPEVTQGLLEELEVGIELAV